MKKETKSLIMLFIAPMIWGGAFVMQCMVDETTLGAFEFNAARHLLGAITLLPVIYFLEKEPRDAEKLKRTAIYGVITGTVLFVASWLQMYGIMLNKSSGKSGFLTGMYIIIVPFLNFLVYKKMVNGNEWLAAFVALAGLFFLSGINGFEKVDVGDILVLAGAFFWAVYILVIDKFVQAVSPIKYSFVQYIACAALNAVFALFTENVTLSGIFLNIVPVLYTGILSIGVGFTFQTLGQRDVNPNFASIILALEGVFAAIAGAVFLGEKMTAMGYLGCVLMFLGTIISQINMAGHCE